MVISRRKFFRNVSLSAAAGLAVPLFDDSSIAHANVLEQSHDPIRLDLNESAYGPSPKVAEAIRAKIPSSSRYPDTASQDLRTAIAAAHKVKPEQVVLGCGSSEILQAVANVHLGPHKRLVLPAPTFDLIARAAGAAGAELVPIPLNHEYAHDLGAMLSHTKDSSGVVYICNPNNPTGTLTPRENVEDFLAKLPSSYVAVVDEAYHHYPVENSSYASFLDKLVDNPHVIVTRTFSHVYGLAGARVGYAIASSDIAQQLQSACMTFGVSTLGAVAALAALLDVDYVRHCADRNRDDRQQFLNLVNARMQRSLDPQANFVFLNTNRPSKEVRDHFAQNHIILGPSAPSMDNYVRVSIGSPAEMHEFWRVWDLSPSTVMSM